MVRSNDSDVLTIFIATGEDRAGNVAVKDISEHLLLDTGCKPPRI